MFVLGKWFYLNINYLLSFLSLNLVYGEKVFFDLITQKQIPRLAIMWHTRNTLFPGLDGNGEYITFIVCFL